MDMNCESQPKEKIPKYVNTEIKLNQDNYQGN